MKLFFIYFSLAFLFISCKNSKLERALEYSKTSIGAQEFQYHKLKDTFFLDFIFNKNLTQEVEYLSSISLMTFYDSIGDINDLKETYIVIALKQPNNKNDKYLYKVSELKYYSEIIKQCATFLANFIERKNQNSINLVDNTLIDITKLEELNYTLDNIKASGSFNYFTIDGFKISIEDNIFQLKASSTGELNIPFTLQYSLTNQNIKYFGINDDL